MYKRSEIAMDKAILFSYSSDVLIRKTLDYLDVVARLATSFEALLPMLVIVAAAVLSRGPLVARR